MACLSASGAHYIDFVEAVRVLVEAVILRVEFLKRSQRPQDCL
jgi:hypothetical protein